MHSVLKSSFEPTILVDYRSDAGPTVTQVRGGLLMSSLHYLKNADLYDQYIATLDPKYKDQIVYAIAASWVPMAAMMAHCDALDRMAIPDVALVRGGESVGREFGTMIYSALLKASRNLGANSGWIVLKQCDRFMQRVYMGGGCTLIQTGPKDAILELHGMPMVASRFFRTSHQAYMTGLARLMGNGSFVKAARPRERDPHRIATSFSWV